MRPYIRSVGFKRDVFQLRTRTMSFLLRIFDKGVDRSYIGCYPQCIFTFSFRIHEFSVHSRTAMVSSFFHAPPRHSRSSSGALIFTVQLRTVMVSLFSTHLVDSHGGRYAQRSGCSLELVYTAGLCKVAFWAWK